MTDYAIIEVPLDLPNIVVRRKTSDPEKPFSINSEIKPFVMALAMKYPQRMFVGRSFFSRDREVNVAKFAVYENRELLGVIGAERDYSRGGNGKTRYTITNERIKGTRQRGDEAYTRDMNKAVKLVGKMFYVKTHAELFKNVAEKTDTLLVAKDSDARREFQRCQSNVMEVLSTYILDNFDQFAPIALQHGTSAEDVNTLLDKRATANLMRGMVTSFRDMRGTTVLLHGNDYVARIGNGPQTEHTLTVWTTDTLPAGIKRAVGMLKLVDKNYIVEGVGAKINDNAFYVLPEVNHE